MIVETIIPTLMLLKNIAIAKNQNIGSDYYNLLESLLHVSANY